MHGADATGQHDSRPPSFRSGARAGRDGLVEHDPCAGTQRRAVTLVGEMTQAPREGARKSATATSPPNGARVKNASACNKMRPMTDCGLQNASLLSSEERFQ